MRPGFRRRVIAGLIAIVSVALGAGAPTASALGTEPYQTLLEPDGTGRLIVDTGIPAPFPAGPPSWQVCRPGLVECAPFATGDFNTGDAPPGSVFFAGGEVVTPLWKGNVRDLTPPSVSGEIRSDRVVAPVAATWEGGWEDDYDQLALQVCRTAAGEGCLQVDHEAPERSCGSYSSTLLDPAFAGRYLRVVDRRYGAGSVFAGVGHPDYYPVPTVVASPTVAVATVGQIAPAPVGSRPKCGFPPLFTATISAAGSAEVTCLVIGCRAVLAARRRGRAVEVREKLSSDPTATVLELTRSDRRRLGPGPTRLRVIADGRTIASRTVVWRAQRMIGPLPGSGEASKEPGTGRPSGT